MVYSMNRHSLAPSTLMQSEAYGIGFLLPANSSFSDLRQGEQPECN